MLRRALEGVVVVGCYSALIALALYPLYADPAHTVLDALQTPSGLGGAADVNLGMWIFAWDWHGLTSAPLRIFDAPIFHPAPRMLAGAEHGLGLMAVYGPIYALSGNPVLANQLNLLLSLSCSAGALYALLRHWGVSRPAAFFGGFAWGAAPMQTNTLFSPALLAGYWLPLAIIALDHVLLGAGARAAAAFAVFLLLHMLTSYYLAYIGLVALGGYVIAVWLTGRHLVARRNLAWLVGAGAAAGAIFVVISLPYLANRDAGVVKDYLNSWRLVGAAAHPWKNYLYPPYAIHNWHWTIPTGPSLYVGMLTLLLALVALWPGRVPATGARRWCTAGAFAMALISWGMSLGILPPWSWARSLWPVMPYRLAVWVIPGFASMRAPNRFGFGVMLGLALLGALGLDRLLSRIRRPPVRVVLAIVAVAVLWMEYDLPDHRLQARVVQTPHSVTKLYDVLAAQPPAPVLEYPMGGSTDMGGVYLESEYMYRAIYHGQRLLNGYTGYYPPSYDVVVALSRMLPDERAFDLLGRITGLRYVVVHSKDTPLGSLPRWLASPRVRLLDNARGHFLFEIATPPPDDLVPALIASGPRATTLTGTPIEVLGPDGTANEITVPQPPASIATALPFRFAVTVTNRSSRPWPSFSPDCPHLVKLSARWQVVGQPNLGPAFPIARLPWDLEPGESVTLPIFANGPPRNGGWLLQIGLTQDDVWFPISLSPLPMHATPFRPPGQ